METYKVKIESLSSNGKGIATLENKPVYIPNTFPGEEVEIELVKLRPYKEGKVISCISKSEERVEPKEDHYITCSPLQSVNYDYQIKLKEFILKDSFKKFSDENVNVDKFVHSKEIFGYRNKLEFHLVSKDGKLFLAFNKRETRNEYEILEDGCALGSQKMNEAALKVLEVINTSHTELVSSNKFKKLVVRESKSNGDILVLLLVKDQNLNLNIQLKELSDSVKGITIAYSPASNTLASVGKIIYKEGKTELEEVIHGKTITYGLQSFFQNNVEIFEAAVSEIKESIAECRKIVELYSGVGSIGLCLQEKAEQIFAYEASKTSIEYAKKNAELNGVHIYKPSRLLSENVATKFLQHTDVLVLDPPRAGLHDKLINKILETKPLKIVYLSCNAKTLAKDYSKLKGIYSIKKLVGFDFYPQTEHLESLMVLDTDFAK